MRRVLYKLQQYVIREEIRYVPAPTQESSPLRTPFSNTLYSLARDTALNIAVDAGKYLLASLTGSTKRLQEENTTLKTEVEKLSKQNKDLADEVTALKEELAENNKRLALITEKLEQLRPAASASQQEPSTISSIEVGSIIIHPGSLSPSPTARETRVEATSEGQEEAVYGVEEKENDNYWQTAVGLSRARSESNRSQEFVRVEQGSVRSASSGSARSFTF